MNGRCKNIFYGLDKINLQGVVCSYCLEVRTQVCERLLTCSLKFNSLLPSSIQDPYIAFHGIVGNWVYDLLTGVNRVKNGIVALNDK